MKTVTLTNADWLRVAALVKRGYEDDGDGRYYSVEDAAKMKGPFIDKDAKAQMTAARRLERQVLPNVKQPR